MPSDIRSFFGGKPAGTPAERPPPQAKEKSTKRGRPRKIVDEDEDDDDAPVVVSEKQIKKKTLDEPKKIQEETTADDYFGKGRKPKRTEPVREKVDAKATPQTSPSKANGRSKPKDAPKATPNGRSSARKKSKAHIDVNEDDFPDDLDDDDGDNFKSAAKTGRRMDDDYEEATEDDEFKPAPRPKSHQVTDTPTKRKTPNKSANASATKRKSSALQTDDEDDLEVEEQKPKKKRATPAKKTASSSKVAGDDNKDSAEIKAIFASIPTITPPSPPTDTAKAKFQYGQHANSAVPAGALNMADLPQGQENCLAGLTFVFTGQLRYLGREQGQNLVKQYGGKVTTAPSKNTNFVVLGEDAGPKKLQTIAQHKLSTINEEGLFDLIRKLPENGGNSAAAAKQAEKREQEKENIRKAAAEMEREERARLEAAKAKAPKAAGKSSENANGKTSAVAPDSRLWTVRYAPSQISQICGNKGQVEKLQNWLRNFPQRSKKDFKVAGPDGSGVYRAVMIHGPPGIGKTTAAHLIAKLEGYDIVESNASDTRSKKLVENGLKGVLSTTSLMGYFAAGSDVVEASKKKLVLIMDEVDGMSAGDRGGVGALAAVCKKTQIPMILICNDRKLPKMKPFDYVTYDLPFRRPTADQIRSRLGTIAYREGLKIPTNVINALIEGSNADIRQVVNMLSTAKLDATPMSFEDGKDMSKAWEKHIILKPWDMVGKILGGGMFNPASASTLNDKQELYFNDHEFAPLMLQENYLGTKPQRGNKYDGNAKMRNLANLDLVTRAAESISDGDLVDRMIHGSQQQWALMPTHAMLSFVRPASYVHGSMAGNQTRFTSWLGKNSNQGKLMRFLKEIQGHMRLRVSADRFEVRQTYLPMLFQQLIERMQREGKESVQEVIDLMDSYYLTKEDWDAVLELGVGPNDMEKIKIDSQVKATFTRLYNQQSHPLPFIKASQVTQPKKALAKERPDLEEALEESDEGEVVDEADDKENEDTDLSKDKYVRQPKKRKAPAAKAGGASKKRKTKGDEDDDGSGDEVMADAKSKKGKAKGKAKK